MTKLPDPYQSSNKTYETLSGIWLGDSAELFFLSQILSLGKVCKKWSTAMQTIGDRGPLFAKYPWYNTQCDVSALSKSKWTWPITFTNFNNIRGKSDPWICHRWYFPPKIKNEMLSQKIKLNMENQKLNLSTNIFYPT